jgi:hypothetical protein
MGWEVRPSFSVSQNADRAELLFEIQNRWGCGHIRPDRSDRTLKFEVRNVGDLIEKVLPHFEAFPIQSSKTTDVRLFRAVCLLIYEGEHKTVEGFSRIVETAMKMNSSGKRKYSGSEILNSLSDQVKV